MHTKNHSSLLSSRRKKQCCVTPALEMMMSLGFKGRVNELSPTMNESHETLYVCVEGITNGSILAKMQQNYSSKVFYCNVKKSVYRGRILSFQSLSSVCSNLPTTVVHIVVHKSAKNDKSMEKKKGSKTP